VLYVVLNPFEQNQICVGLHFHWRSNYQDREGVDQSHQLV
jgi:hypothetical protein